MKKIKIIYFLPFIISILLILVLSLLIFDLIISDIIVIFIILFGISGIMLNKNWIVGNIVGIIPAIICTYLGLQENGQWINEIIFAIPIYIYYIICTIVMVNNKTRAAKKKI